MRRVSALVPQDDLLTPSLTTQEALMEATIFKTSLGLAERQARVDRLLTSAGMRLHRELDVANRPETRRSGGRSRVYVSPHFAKRWEAIQRGRAGAGE